VQQRTGSFVQRLQLVVAAFCRWASDDSESQNQGQGGTRHDSELRKAHHAPWDNMMARPAGAWSCPAIRLGRGGAQQKCSVGICLMGGNVF